MSRSEVEMLIVKVCSKIIKTCDKANQKARYQNVKVLRSLVPTLEYLQNMLKDGKRVPKDKNKWPGYV